MTLPEIAAGRDADATERYLHEHGLKNTCIVANRVNVDLMQQGLLPSLDAVTNMFTGPLVGVIQEDDNIRISTNRGIPIVCKQGTYIEKNFNNILYRILG